MKGLTIEVVENGFIVYPDADRLRRETSVVDRYVFNDFDGMTKWMKEQIET